MTSLNSYLRSSKTIPNAPDLHSLELNELSSNGTSTTTIQAADSLSASYSLTLPVDDGTSNQVLKTDGNGVLSWTAQSGGATSLSQLSDVTLSEAGLKTIASTDMEITATGDITLDADGDINLEADGSNVKMKYSGSESLEFYVNDSGHPVIQSKVDAKDLILTQNDNAEVARFTDARHVEIQGGLKIGRGGLDYGNISVSVGDDTRGQLFIQGTYNGNTSEDHGWWIGTQNQALTFNDNDLHFLVVRDGTTTLPAYIADHIADGLMNFTGQHRCFINHELSDMVGLLVSSTGIYVNIDNSNQPSINESLPICQLSSIQNDKSIFGVVSSKEDTNSNRKFAPSNFVSVYPKTNTNERRYHINSLGEGSIWITNKNNNLQNGDYITSSTIQGYGQKQTEPQLYNYTVAKITCDCNFSITPIVKRKVKVIVTTGSQTLDLDSSGNIQFEDDLDSEGNQQQVYPFETRFLLADGTQITESEYVTRLSNLESVYAACFVGCTYHCA